MGCHSNNTGTAGTVADRPVELLGAMWLACDFSVKLVVNQTFGPGTPARRCMSLRVNQVGYLLKGFAVFA